MTNLNVGDYVQIHLAGAEVGSLGDGSVVRVTKAERVGGRILCIGAYEDCGGSVQFTGSECTIVKRN